MLGPVSLTSLGVGCIIGAGIFVMTGRAAAQDAGPAVVISFAIAGLGCALAALCYAEFAAMAPVAGSAYTYAYTTLGEIFAWIIGWDLILEYAMGCATVASAWSSYLNEFLWLLIDTVPQFPSNSSHDPFTPVEGRRAGMRFNLPSVLIMAVVTIVLVLGIRESARTNALLVIIKLVVVVFVIVVGLGLRRTAATGRAVPVTQRALPQEKQLIPEVVQRLPAKTTAQYTNSGPIELNKELVGQPIASMRQQEEAARLQAEGKLVRTPKAARELADLAARVAGRPAANGRRSRRSSQSCLPQGPRPKASEGRGRIVGHAGPAGPRTAGWCPSTTPRGAPSCPTACRASCWGRRSCSSPTSASTRSRPTPRRPAGRSATCPSASSSRCCSARCLYIAVAAVITGMVPYPKIDIEAPIAAAFAQKAAAEDSRHAARGRRR